MIPFPFKSSHPLCAAWGSGTRPHSASRPQTGGAALDRSRDVAALYQPRRSRFGVGSLVKGLQASSKGRNHNGSNGRGGRQTCGMVEPECSPRFRFTVAPESPWILEATEEMRMPKGNTPRITAGVADLAQELSAACDDYVRTHKVVDLKVLQLRADLRRLAEKADIADATLGLMLSGLHEDGIESTRWQRLLTELTAFHHRRNAA